MNFLSKFSLIQKLNELSLYSDNQKRKWFYEWASQCDLDTSKLDQKPDYSFSTYGSVAKIILDGFLIEDRYIEQLNRFCSL